MLDAIIDHVLIHASDLEEASRRYAAAGFNVTPGGRHPGYTHNALIPFADGSYLELIATHTTPPAEEQRYWQRYGRDGGLFGFALGMPSVEQALTEVRSRGLTASGPHAGARARPDGVQVAWRTASIDDEQPGTLPFLIDDVTARDVRVPGGAAAQHANGVRGLAALSIAVRDLEAASRRYAALLGREPASAAGVARASFELGRQQIVLIAAADLKLPSDFLAHGDRLYELVLAGERATALDPGQLGGARVRIIAEGA